MHRFAFFVDGSNLDGSLKSMKVRVPDYERFYRHIFEKAVAVWRGSFEASSPPAAQLHRVYWYRVGSMDEYRLEDATTQARLRERFEKSPRINKAYKALAGQAHPGSTPQEVSLKAWGLCFEEFKQWYEGCRGSLAKRRKFHHGVRRSTDFIEIIDCGHWQIDLLTMARREKGLDTRLALDMLALEANYDVAVVLSGDADSIPSISHLKTRNKHVAAVEFVQGYPPEKEGRGFASRLRLAADFVVRVYEMDLITTGLADKQAETADLEQSESM